jgi:uncharacterized protein involved in outer membrane biogenesis
MGRKVILIGAAAVLVVAIVAVVQIAGRVDGYVARAIEDYGSAATGTNVNVGGVDIAVTQGRGNIGQLTVGNPQGFDTEYALKLDDVRLAVELSSLTGSVPVVSEAVVDGAHLNLEQRGDATNLTGIQQHMKQNEEPTESTLGQEGRITIERFLLTNATVTLTSELLDAPETVELEDVVVQGIGRNGGATYDEATEALMTPILAAARSAAQDRVRKEATDAAREKVEEKAREKLEDLLDRG